MRIIEYPLTESLSDDDVLVIDGETGTRTIKAIDTINVLMDLMSVNNRRMLFRGKNLGSVLTAEQKSSIQSGTFKGLCIGDYWVIGGVNWRIADFDYWYGAGDSELADHHILIIPDTNLSEANMNDSNSTDGGYKGSKMYTTNINTAKNTINSAFGSNVLSHREYLTNTVTNGVPTGGDWNDSTVELLNEPMIYGHYIYTPSNNGDNNVKRQSVSNTQLALFQIAPHFVNKPDGATSRITYWLRDVANSTSFVSVSSYGTPQDTAASQEYGIRPVFAIG